MSQEPNDSPPTPGSNYRLNPGTEIHNPPFAEAIMRHMGGKPRSDMTADEASVLREWYQDV